MTSRPGDESYRKTREDLTTMDKLHMALTELSYSGKVEKNLPGSLDSIPSPSVKIQIMGRKVCWRFKGNKLLGIIKTFCFENFVDITQLCLDLLYQVNFSHQ